MCYLFLRQKETEHEQRRVRERGRERIPSRLCAISKEPDGGLNPTNCEIMSQAEIKSHILNLLSHPGVPET